MFKMYLVTLNEREGIAFGSVCLLLGEIFDFVKYVGLFRLFVGLFVCLSGRLQPKRLDQSFLNFYT